LEEPKSSSVFSFIYSNPSSAVPSSLTILVLPSITYLIVAFFSIPTAERADTDERLVRGRRGLPTKITIRDDIHLSDEISSLIRGGV